MNSAISSQLDRAGLPANIDAERYVLGGIFASPDQQIFARVSEIVRETSFSLEKHKRMFSVMRTVFDRGSAINYGTVMHELQRREWLETVGSISEYSEGFPQIHNIESFCRIVAEEDRLRRIFQIFHDGQGRVLEQDSSGDIIATTQRSLTAPDMLPVTGETLDPAEIIEQAGGLNHFLSPELEPGIMTPWPRLNRTINGLRKGQSIAIGAKPGIGKTSLAGNIALGAVLNKHRVKIESHEMLKGDLLFRMICTLARVDSQAARAGRLGRIDREALAYATQQLVELKDYLRIGDRGNKTVSSVAAYLRRQKAIDEPIELLIVDYLQKMHGIGRFERREQEVSQVSAGLNEVAHDFEIPVVILAQINVDFKEQYKTPPSIDDFRESKAIGQDADLAIMLRLRDAEQLYKPVRTVDAFIVKQRNGATGRIPYLFYAAHCYFEEAPDGVETPTERPHRGEEAA